MTRLLPSRDKELISSTRRTFPMVRMVHAIFQQEMLKVLVRDRSRAAGPGVSGYPVDLRGTDEG